MLTKCLLCGWLEGHANKSIQPCVQAAAQEKALRPEQGFLFKWLIQPERLSCFSTKLYFLKEHLLKQLCIIFTGILFPLLYDSDLEEDSFKVFKI